MYFLTVNKRNVIKIVLTKNRSILLILMCSSYCYGFNTLRIARIGLQMAEIRPKKETCVVNESVCNLTGLELY